MRNLAKPVDAVANLRDWSSLRDFLAYTLSKSIILVYSVKWDTSH